MASLRVDILMPPIVVTPMARSLSEDALLRAVVGVPSTVNQYPVFLGTFMMVLHSWSRMGKSHVDMENTKEVVKKVWSYEVVHAKLVEPVWSL